MYSVLTNLFALLCYLKTKSPMYHLYLVIMNNNQPRTLVWNEHEFLVISGGYVFKICLQTHDW